MCKDSRDIISCQAEERLCLVIGKDKCDEDPKCFGFSWHSTSIYVGIRLCQSTEREFKNDGWRTIMKVPKGILLFTYQNLLILSF